MKISAVVVSLLSINTLVSVNSKCCSNSVGLLVQAMSCTADLGGQNAPGVSGAASSQNLL